MVITVNRVNQIKKDIYTAISQREVVEVENETSNAYTKIWKLEDTNSNYHEYKMLHLHKHKNIRVCLG